MAPTVSIFSILAPLFFALPAPLQAVMVLSSGFLSFGMYTTVDMQRDAAAVEVQMVPLEAAKPVHPAEPAKPAAPAHREEGE